MMAKMKEQSTWQEPRRDSPLHSLEGAEVKAPKCLYLLRCILRGVHAIISLDVFTFFMLEKTENGT
jgi:hypothetical protein